MSIITAKTLFHFTQKKDTLFKILENGFRPSYSKEFGAQTGWRIKRADICMACFCDLPLSSIEKHINGFQWTYGGNGHSFNGYGKYGLGMSKEWGRRNGLNPVTYISWDSYYATLALRLNKKLLELHNHFQGKISGKNPPRMKTRMQQLTRQKHNLQAIQEKATTVLLGESLTDIQAMLAYFKPYEDHQTGQIYYNEREWRYTIPYNLESNFEVPVIFPEDYPQMLDMKEGVMRIVEEKYMLKFEANDIKYNSSCAMRCL